jgi:hypothetical protein
MTSDAPLALGTEKPPTVKIKAIDAKPHRYALWCSVAGEDGKQGAPFANEIGPRSWSDDGQHIWFMLDTHNFFKAKPDEELELIPLPTPKYVTPEMMAERENRDAQKMAKRPTICESCGHKPTHRVGTDQGPTDQ